MPIIVEFVKSVLFLNNNPKFDSKFMIIMHIKVNKKYLINSKKNAAKEVTNYMTRDTKFQTILSTTNNKNRIQKTNDCKNLDANV